MHKFGYMRLFREDVGFFHKLYFILFGVSPDHKLRFMYFQKALKDKLHRKKLFNILDAGCGSGDYSFFLSEKYPEAIIDSIDTDKESITRNRKIISKLGFRKIEFNLGDLTKINQSNKYDMICCIDVLEHIPDTKEALSRLFCSLKDDGHLYIHMPLTKKRPVILNRYLKEFHEWVKKEHTAESLKFEDLAECLKDCGFEIDFLQYSFKHYFGELSVSLIMLFYKNNLFNNIAKALLTPLLQLLIHMDVAIKSNDGNAIAVMCKKRSYVSTLS